MNWGEFKRAAPELADLGQDYIHFGEEREVIGWDPANGVRSRTEPNP